ncbi:hypothetical protein QUB47_28355 [Microcoleus sp. AT9_B5]
MEIKTTPWYETRSLIPPQIEMLQEGGMIQYKGSFLKKESPKNATLKSRFIHYDANYVKYCFLKEFYSLAASCGDDTDKNKLLDLVEDCLKDFFDYCRENSTEEVLPRETFRAFCKTHLYNAAAKET